LYPNSYPALWPASQPLWFRSADVCTAEPAGAAAEAAKAVGVVATIATVCGGGNATRTLCRGSWPPDWWPKDGKTGPSWTRRYGQDFWADLAEHPQLRESFDRQMTQRLRDGVPSIFAGIDRARFSTLVDVGPEAAHPTSRILELEPTTSRH
jgi:hypothetical protein